MMLLRLLYFSIGGCLIGLMLSYLLLGGYFVQWHMLPSTPFPDPHLASVVGQRLFIRFQDAITYTCVPKMVDCWKPEDIPTERPANPSTLLNECTLLAPMTIITARPPQIQECMQGSGNYTDASSDFAYVRDPQGRLWSWSHFREPRLEDFLPRFFSIAGGIFGFLIGGIRELWRKLMQRKRSVSAAPNNAH